MFGAIKRFFGGGDKVVTREEAVKVQSGFLLPGRVGYPARAGSRVRRSGGDMTRIVDWRRAGYIVQDGSVPRADGRKGRPRTTYVLTKLGAMKVNAWRAKHEA